MKLFRLFFLISLSLTILACDKVDNPFSPPEGGPGNAAPDAQKVLLEDITGFLCSNCPQANSTADNLSEVYGDQLIVVGVHGSSFFSTPYPPSAPYYTTDFRTEAAIAYYENLFGSPGLPNGSINRLIVDDSRISGHPEWGERVAALVGGTAPANIKINVDNYNPTSRTVSFEVDMQVTQELDPGEYFMTIYLVEDSIYDWQLDGSENIENYLHRHVLRDNVNGTWGQSVFPNGEPNQQNTLNFEYTLDAAWVDHNCELVAYIYHGDTREVVQVDKAHVIPE